MICFRGAKCGKEGFFREMPLGPVVSLELFVSGAMLPQSRILLPTSGFFFGEAVALLRKSYTFL